MSEKESGGPDIHQLPFSKQHSVRVGGPGRVEEKVPLVSSIVSGGDPGRVEEKVGRKEDKNTQT